MGKEKDIKVDINGVEFMVRSCAIVENDNKFLFQKRKKDKFWALPGGKVEVMERTKDTLKRELQEELGIKDIKILGIMSIVENFFEFDGKKIHQYIFTHKVKLNDNKYNKIEGVFEGIEKDKDIVFTWIKREDLKTISIKPDYVVDQILSNSNEVQFYTCME